MLSISTLKAQFSSETKLQADQIDNNTGVDIILNPVNSVKVNSFSSGFALQSGASQEIEESTVTNTELGYLSGVTSAIQTQIDSKQPTLTGTDGDLYYWNSGLANLGIGLDGQVLQVSALGFPEWADLVAVSVTTKGDIQTYSTEPDRLPVGADNQILSANSATSTGLEWIDPPSTSPTTTLGDMIYRGASEDVRLPIGTDDQLLTVVSGEPAWADAPVSTTLTAKGEIQGHDGTNNIAIDAATQDGQLLTSLASENSGWKALNPILKDTALVNSGFELGTTGWTITGDCTPTIESSVPYLDNVLKLTCVNQQFSVKQNTTELTGFVDQQALLTAQVKANIGGAFIRTLNNDVEASSASIIAGDYKAINIPDKIASTSNGVEIHTNGVNVTGEFFIDEVGYRLAPDLIQQVGQAQFVGDVYVGSTNCTWSGTSTTFASFAADSDCNYIVSGNLAEPDTKIPAIKIPNARTDGYYKVTFGGTFNTGVAAGTNCDFTLSSDGTNQNKMQVRSDSDDSRFSQILTDSFRFDSTGDKQVELIYQRQSGTVSCVTQGSDDLPLKMSVNFYPDSNSTIVSQQTELTAATANYLSARIDGTVSPSTVSNENYDWINGNCTRLSDGVFQCDTNVNATNLNCFYTSTGTQTIGLSGRIQIVDADTIQIYVSNDNTAAQNRPFNVFCDKGADVNKSQTIIGKFANINDTELCQVIAKNNDGDNIAANTEDIPYKTIQKDNCNLWGNGGNTGANTNDQYTANISGLISVDIRATTTSTSGMAFDVYEGGSFYWRCGNNPTGANEKNTSCKFEVTKGNTYTFRFTVAFTLSASDNHTIVITELPDLSAIVENLNNNPRANREDQYSESEILWGKWNGQQLYRRCFTFSGSYTTGTTDLDTSFLGSTTYNVKDFFYTIKRNDGLFVESSIDVYLHYRGADDDLEIVVINNTWEDVTGCLNYTK